VGPVVQAPSLVSIPAGSILWRVNGDVKSPSRFFVRLRLTARRVGLLGKALGEFLASVLCTTASCWATLRIARVLCMAWLGGADAGWVLEL
jgi:hypothetical protein